MSNDPIVRVLGWNGRTGYSAGTSPELGTGSFFFPLWFWGLEKNNLEKEEPDRMDHSNKERPHPTT